MSDDKEWMKVKYTTKHGDEVYIRGVDAEDLSYSLVCDCDDVNNIYATKTKTLTKVD